MPQERALGAAIIAVIIGIVGFFVLVAGILALAASAFGQHWGGSFSTTTFLSFLTSNGTVLAAIVIVVGLIFLGIATGLYRQHFWALVVMFVFGVFYLIGEGSGVAYSLFYASPKQSITSGGVLTDLVAIIIVVLVLAYLAAVRDDFI